MATQVDGFRLVLAVVAATSVGLMGANLQPMLIGAIMDGFSLTAGQAGLAGSVELGAIAVASLLIARRVSSLSRTRLALVGAVVTILGYGLSAAAPSFGLLVGARLVAGCGEGAILAAGNAAAASARDPDRLWALLRRFSWAASPTPSGH
jgi:predicted MFS family arabinose efflux permease